jgi:pimeloyl-ACP methyl ester carboxylesterase
MKRKVMAIDVRTRIISSALAIATIMFSMGKDLMAQTNTSTVVKNIVLVHGGFVDGSGWQGVYQALKNDGYTVSIVQNPTISLAGDVAVTKRAIAAQNGPVILVGHSYGGVVITEAGNDPKVAGLVYITAFAPDKDESVSSLIKIRLRARPFRRSCRRRMDIYSSIRRSSRPHSPRT